MSKSKAKADAPKTTERPKRNFYLPTVGKSVQASSQQEAVELVTKPKKAKEGDGNN